MTREDSVHRSRVLEALTRELRDVSFPVTRDELVRAKGNLPLRFAPGTAVLPLGELLSALPANAFSSAEHVREVVDLSWHDLAGVVRFSSAR